MSVAAPTLCLADRALDLSCPRVMGVINVTPDSFSDGGRHLDPGDALACAAAMAAAGADILDVGGESTRPGAAPVQPAEELRRVLPVVEGIARLDLGLPISIDTRRAEVARAALAAGARIVNDVSGLEDPRMAETCAAAGAGLIIGHIQGQPATMQRDPRYADVVGEVRAALAAARTRAIAAGVAPAGILLDPGIGFGKTLEHNLSLLAQLDALTALAPVCVGISRKSMLGTLLEGRPPGERLHGGLGAAVAAVLAGARVVRTHDVGPTRDALRVAWSIHGARHAKGAADA